MTGFPDIGGRARLVPRPHEAFSPRVLDSSANWVGFRAGAAALDVDRGWLPASAPHFDWPDAPDVAAPAPRGFDMAAVRPGQEQSRPKVERPALAGGWSWGVACSLGLHVAALMALLVWPTPVAETPAPEPVTVEIIVEAPAPVIREAPPPPPAVAEAPSPPVEQMSPPAVSTPPVEPPAATVEPPPVAEAPPPPVVESTPVSETPARLLEETPPPPPPPQPAPVASPATPPVRKPPPPAPAKARLAAPEPAPAASKPTKPAPAARQAAAPVVSSAEAAAYQSAVLSRIAAQKRYPEAARERAPHGVAVVSFSINASGQVAGASISQSAGDPILDAEALATVRRASPFPPPPAGAPRNFLASLSFRVR